MHFLANEKKRKIVFKYKKNIQTLLIEHIDSNTLQVWLSFDKL